jgi:hypothetical protein
MDTPELDRAAESREERQAIGSFLEWFNGRTTTVPGANSPRYMLVIVDLDGDTYVCPPIGSLLAEYYDLDEEKMEAERKALLEHVRSLHEPS